MQNTSGGDFFFLTDTNDKEQEEEEQAGYCNWWIHSANGLHLILRYLRAISSETV